MSETLNVVIVGAGIGGLAAYIALKKHLTVPHTITVLEAYPIKAGLTIGGGLGVGPNGMRTLRKLDANLHASVTQQGYPVPRFEFKTSKGRSLGGFSTTEKNGPEKTVMIGRQALSDCLLKLVDREDLQSQRKVVDIGNLQNGSRTLTCDDGSVFDNIHLIIGADGVRSSLRKHVVGAGYDAKYLGLVGVGGSMPSSYLPPLPLPPPKSPVVMTFGANGVFGYAPFSSRGSTEIDQELPNYGEFAMWWSQIQADKPFEGTAKDPKVVARVKEIVFARQGKWPDPIVSKIVKETSVDLVLPIHTTPKLPSWGKNGIVLLGDAAHAFPPTSGQGASQAFEDALALGLLLEAFLQLKEDKVDAIENVIDAYTKIRKPRTDAILDFSTRMAGSNKDKTIIGEWFTYFFMWLMVKGAFAWLVPDMDTVLYKYDLEEDVQRIVRSNTE